VSSDLKGFITDVQSPKNLGIARFRSDAQTNILRALSKSKLDTLNSECQVHRGVEWHTHEHASPNLAVKNCARHHEELAGWNFECVPDVECWHDELGSLWHFCAKWHVKATALNIGLA
jgi:hypothetical protein